MRLRTGFFFIKKLSFLHLPSSRDRRPSKQKKRLPLRRNVPRFCDVALNLYKRAYDARSADRKQSSKNGANRIASVFFIEFKGNNARLWTLRKGLTINIRAINAHATVVTDCKTELHSVYFNGADTLSLAVGACKVVKLPDCPTLPILLSNSLFVIKLVHHQSHFV